MGDEWCIRGRRLDEELLRNVPVDRWDGGGGGLYSLVVDFDMTLPFLLKNNKIIPIRRKATCRSQKRTPEKTMLRKS